MRRLTLLIALLALAAPVLAAEKIYRSTDEDGTPVFTDDPPSDDAEPLELDPLTTVPSQDVESGVPDEDPSSGTSQSGEQAKQDALRYQGIRVTYPPEGQAVRHNGGLVPFRVELAPEGMKLAQGHQVEILLDGEPRGSGSSLQVSVSPVNRGPHTVRARIVDGNGSTVMTSDPVDFILLRKALGEQAN